ncbi:hypothetical protein [Paenibacillus larvae]|uniref:Uncharacterized protein n=1 Tax=Paenibacillus larvae subsp. larvae TaxID=147375 RepID=A0A6C0QZA3_9BACL|nr:hypothetical protein [Paenibacillus larvae]QHZ54055.1 hypothetical protein ERICV_05071 [Paenibacillus larvae subsp. larvae]
MQQVHNSWFKSFDEIQRTRKRMGRVSEEMKTISPQYHQLSSEICQLLQQAEELIPKEFRLKKSQYRKISNE